MKDNRRTQAERSAGTRDALIAAGRSLFAGRGYANVATEEIVRMAGVTRGALYHHFDDKTGLFAAVFEIVEAEVLGRIGEEISNAGQSDPIALMRLGASAWLDACGEPDVRQIALLDAPVVLGLTHWREISSRYGSGVVDRLLAQAIEAGSIPRQPLAPLAHVLLGALREGALFLASAADPIEARRDIGEVIDRLIQSFGKA